jgi:hypothetical protein
LQLYRDDLFLEIERAAQEGDAAAVLIAARKLAELESLISSGEEARQLLRILNRR